MSDGPTLRGRVVCHSGTDPIQPAVTTTAVANSAISTSQAVRTRHNDSSVQTNRLQDAMTSGSTSSHSSKYTNTVEETSSAEQRVTSEEEAINRFGAPFLFSDIVIEVEGRTFHSHRAMLALWSPVFRAMFQNSCQETTTSRIKLKADKAVDIGELLLHIYTPGGRDFNVPTALQLLPMVHRYQIDTLLTAIENRLCQSITESNSFEFHYLAELYQLSNLQQKALDRCSRLEKIRLDKEMEISQLSNDSKMEIYKYRIGILEQVITNIHRSLSVTCIKLENKTERVPANHCNKHNRPFSSNNETGEPCNECVDTMRTHLMDMCKQAMNKTVIHRETCTTSDSSQTY